MDEAGVERLRGVFHSFTGGRAELERALSYGFMIGINGIVTFKNSGLEEVVQSIPTDRLLLETDAPFLARIRERYPEPHPASRIRLSLSSPSKLKITGSMTYCRFISPRSFVPSIHQSAKSSHCLLIIWSDIIEEGSNGFLYCQSGEKFDSGLEPNF